MKQPNQRADWDFQACGLIRGQFDRRADGPAAALVARGSSQILGEQVVHDRDSDHLLTANFMDYVMPRADTTCESKIVSNPHPTPSDPPGAKEAGEAGCVGAPPAVMIAIITALTPIGVRELDMPATPERVRQVIRRGRATA